MDHDHDNKGMSGFILFVVACLVAGYMLYPFYTTCFLAIIVVTFLLVKM